MHPKVKIAGKSPGWAILPGMCPDGSGTPRKLGKGEAGERDRKLGPSPQGLGANVVGQRRTAYLSSMRSPASSQASSSHRISVPAPSESWGGHMCLTSTPWQGYNWLISWGPSWYLATGQQMHCAALPVQNVLHKICFKNNYMSKLSWRLATDFLNLVARSQKMIKPQALF